MDTQTNDDVLKSDFFSRLSKMIPHKQKNTGKFYPIPRNFRMNVKAKQSIPIYWRGHNRRVFQIFLGKPRFYGRTETQKDKSPFHDPSFLLLGLLLPSD